MTTPNNSPRVRTGFNGQGTLDLNHLKVLPVLQFKDAVFSHFEFTDLDTVDVESENFRNVGIREDFDIDGRIERYQVSFQNLGFLMTEWPPSRDTDGEYLEGRGRTLAAKLNGERWMPTAVYTRTDSSLRNTVTNGFLAHSSRPPEYGSTFHDFVEAGVHLVTSQELPKTKADIDQWLYKEVMIERVFNNSNGQITKIRDQIIERSTRDESLILRRSTAEWHKWIKANQGLSRSQYVLVSCDDTTRAMRLWCDHVLPAVKEGREPVNIIYYTNKYSPTDARTGLNDSMAKLEEFFKSSFELVNSQVPGVTLQVPTGRPYTFLGALPQIVKSHNVTGPNLVNVTKY
jgi:hypothetical protein